MAIRWISLVAIVCALAACAEGGIGGGTRQFSGVWLYEFEGSTFIEGATETPTARPEYEETDWLEWIDWPVLERLMEENMEDASFGGGECHTVQPFLLTFVGRRTHYPISGTGHLGLWRSKVTAHRPISARRLGPPFCYEQ